MLFTVELETVSVAEMLQGQHCNMFIKYAGNFDIMQPDLCYTFGHSVILATYIRHLSVKIITANHETVTAVSLICIQVSRHKLQYTDMFCMLSHAKCMKI